MQNADPSKETNKHLAEVASQAGVTNYGRFTNYGYMGLYGGLSMQQIYAKRRLKPTQKILDHMGSEELLAGDDITKAKRRISSPK